MTDQYCFHIAQSSTIDIDIYIGITHKKAIFTKVSQILLFRQSTWYR